MPPVDNDPVPYPETGIPRSDRQSLLAAETRGRKQPCPGGDPSTRRPGRPRACVVGDTALAEGCRASARSQIASGPRDTEAEAGVNPYSNSADSGQTISRPHECGRCTHECVRHDGRLKLALMG